MQTFKAIDTAIIFDKVLQHRHHLKQGEKKAFNITRLSFIILHRMSKGVITSKGIFTYLLQINRMVKKVPIHLSLQQLLKERYCTRSRYGMAYYYKITAKGIALLCMIEEELENIVNSNDL